MNGSVGERKISPSLAEQQHPCIYTYIRRVSGFVVRTKLKSGASTIEREQRTGACIAFTRKVLFLSFCLIYLSRVPNASKVISHLLRAQASFYRKKSVCFFFSTTPIRQKKNKSAGFDFFFLSSFECLWCETSVLIKRKKKVTRRSELFFYVVSLLVV